MDVGHSMGNDRTAPAETLVDLPRGQPMLSPRELEIARMVAAGLPNKTIAAVLDISVWTDGTHLRRMFAKEVVTSRAALIARLMQKNALSPAHAHPPR